MAFAQNELSLMAYTGAAGSFTQYAYANTEADNVAAAGFFNAAAGELDAGDTIYVVNTGITFRVTDVSDAGVVTVAANYAAPG